MSKIASLALLVIIILAFFALGGGVGIFYQSQKEGGQPGVAENILKNLNSKAVPSIIAYGQVTKIDGRNVTLSFNGDSVTIKINDSASINSFVKSASGTTTQQKMNFSQIKKGDTLSVNVKLLPDGNLQGESVIILSTPAAK